MSALASRDDLIGEPRSPPSAHALRMRRLRERDGKLTVFLTVFAEDASVEIEKDRHMKSIHLTVFSVEINH